MSRSVGEVGMRRAVGVAVLVAAAGALVLWLASGNSVAPNGELAAARATTGGRTLSATDRPTPTEDPYPGLTLTPAPSITPNATHMAMSHSEVRDMLVDMMEDTEWYGPVITVVDSADIYATDAHSLGMTAEKVQWGSEPDFALLAEGRDRDGERVYVMWIWERAFSSLLGMKRSDSLSKLQQQLPE